jgi:predicted nucleic acid-binding protein
VSAFVDTNIIVRALVGDAPDMSRRATAYLKSEDDLFVTDLIVAETIYVLESFYEIDRPRIADALRSFLSLESVRVVDGLVLLRSLQIYEQHRIDFSEAYLVACAESTGVRRIASFDRSIDRVTTVERIEP